MKWWVFGAEKWPKGVFRGSCHRSTFQYECMSAPMSIAKDESILRNFVEKRFKYSHFHYQFLIQHFSTKIACLSLFFFSVSCVVPSTFQRALRIILGTDYISYANALDVCDVDRLSARREQHSLKFAQSLPKCSRTSKLLPPCRGEIHGRQLRSNAKLTQPRARTNRYACSPIPYYVELINSQLP